MTDQLAEKSKVLNWMLKNDTVGIDDAGFVVASYYRHRDKVMGLVNEDVPYSRDLL
jgi:hypothetical protein